MFQNGEPKGDYCLDLHAVSPRKRSSDPEGYVANKPNVWGTMPYKGLIYFSDMNNGLCAIRLEEENMGTN